MFLRIAYSLVSLASLPALALLTLVRPRLRSYWRERFAGGRYQDLGTLKSPVWFHGASVGEVAGLSPLVNRVKDMLGEESIFISTTSETGQGEIARRGLTSHSCVLPFDSPLLLEKAVDSISPRCVVIAETELWPGLLMVLAKKKVPVFLVNARVSDHSYPNYLRFNFLLRNLLRSFEFIIAQSKLDGERFVRLGASEERVFVGGSTKFDQAALEYSSSEILTQRRDFGIREGSFCFVAGSVRQSEEKVVLDAYVEAKRQLPTLSMVFAPRHAERFDEVRKMLEGEGLDFRQRSKATTGEPSSDILLLDTIGELRKAYAIGDIAFVGGTIDPIGGHNPMEAAIQEMPVILGPNVGNIRDAVKLLESSGGLCRAGDSIELADCLIRLGRSSSELERVGAAAKVAAMGCVGATDFILSKLGPTIGRVEDLALKAAAGASTAC